jgi:hypothetical protein
MVDIVGIFIRGGHFIFSQANQIGRNFLFEKKNSKKIIFPIVKKIFQNLSEIKTKASALASRKKCFIIRFFSWK